MRCIYTDILNKAVCNSVRLFCENIYQEKLSV